MGSLTVRRLDALPVGEFLLSGQLALGVGEELGTADTERVEEKNFRVAPGIFAEIINSGEMVCGGIERLAKRHGGRLREDTWSVGRGGQAYRSVYQDGIAVRIDESETAGDFLKATFCFLSSHGGLAQVAGVQGECGLVAEAGGWDDLDLLAGGSGQRQDHDPGRIGRGEAELVGVKVAGQSDVLHGKGDGGELGWRRGWGRGLCPCRWSGESRACTGCTRCSAGRWAGWGRPG